MRDAGGRPRAWGVLAVALALMALVVALSATRHHHTGGIAPRHATEASPQPSAVLHGTHVTSTTSSAGIPLWGRTARPHGVPGRALQAPVGGRAGVDLLGALGLPAAGGPSRLSQKVSGAAGETTGSTAAAPAPSTPLAGGQVPTATAGTGPAGGTESGGTAGSGYPGRGEIGPADTSATYAVPGGGIVTAAATWTGTALLELSISCGSGGVAVSRTGSSGLSVELDDAGDQGQCAVTLALVPGTSADVTYTLAVQPAP